MDIAELRNNALVVLSDNDRGDYTVPSGDLYPHQWMWDSCFIAIGLRHIDIHRAQKEILSLTSGQWSNGMLPNMIFAPGNSHNQDSDIWRSWLSPFSPSNINTSGITQPPMLAEAVVRIGQKLKPAERRIWYKKLLPIIVKHHDWLYTERDPHKEGLTLQIHPWETGLDNSPAWMHELHEHQMPLWIRFIAKTHLDRLIEPLRKDTRTVPVAQRQTNIDALALYSIQRRLRRKNYDIDRILRRSFFAIEDLTFNCILIRANTLLKEIAATLDHDLPEELSVNMKKSEEALEQLWDEETGQYYCREHVTHDLLKIPSIATLMPLYAGCISPNRAEQLSKHLYNTRTFGTDFPVPSVPKSSTWYDPKRYWQGPTWMNTNWLIIDGLKRYGFDELVEALTASSLEMVQKSGFYEYFSPEDASPAGAPNFSWTAALTVDLLESTSTSN